MTQQSALKITEKVPERFYRIKETLMSEPVYLCPERALLITEYFKKHDNKKEPMVIRRAKALRHLLMHKSVKIWPDELIVGNVGTKRKSGGMEMQLNVLDPDMLVDAKTHPGKYPGIGEQAKSFIASLPAKTRVFVKDYFTLVATIICLLILLLALLVFKFLWVNIKPVLKSDIK
ncbi:MAG: pyruvate formate lyase family protein [Dissulfuribacterales bacterium]